MVYIPRERFSTDLRTEIIRILERAYGGRTSTFYTQLTDSPLARLHILTETATARPNRSMKRRLKKSSQPRQQLGRCPARCAGHQLQR
jgi:NAD-specific glutamate dehydrogenase